MIKMKRVQIMRSTEFAMAMQAILSAKVDNKLAYSLKKLNDAFVKTKKQIEREYKEKVLDVYAEKNADGSIKMKADDVDQFSPIPGKVEELKKFQEEFWDGEVTVDRSHIRVEDLAQIKLSAIDLTALAPIYVELAAVGASTGAVPEAPSQHA